MPIPLSAVEARVLGSLIEKSLTTPDHYPLSLNVLVNACNQKSSRDPVMQLDETTVVRALATLKEKNLISHRSEPGNRVPKFLHHVENLLNGGSAREVGAICVLLLRGPQTPGEIKTRTDRLCEFTSTAEVETVLNDLAGRPDGPMIARLPRQPGQKEARFVELFSEKATPPPLSGGKKAQGTAKSSVPGHAAKSPSLDDRITGLEQRIDTLETKIRALQPKN